MRDRKALDAMDEEPRCPLCGGQSLQREYLQQIATIEYWEDGEKVDQEENDSYGDAPNSSVRWRCVAANRCNWYEDYNTEQGG